ncbi:MAG TPA: DUF6247 family protein [Actinophytocola sp.]|nr:DUF6247 family protein [Actinophytocola sp.]
MTAAAAYPDPEPKRPPFADASPAEVRAALIPEEATVFDREWRAALAEATETFDLTAVHETLEHWRRIAWMTTAHGPEAHRRMLARAEYTLRTGKLPPGVVTHSADEVRAMIRERLGL